MTTFRWYGETRTMTMRDVGSLDDPSDFKLYEFRGIYTKDLFYGGKGVDRLIGTKYNDLIFFDSIGSVRPTSLKGIETIYGGDGHDLIDMTSVRFKYPSVTLDGGTGNDWLLANAGADILYGGSGADRLKGYGGHDKLYGGSGNDLLFGGAGSDWLTGGTGVDHLLGGAAADAFIFTSVADSKASAPDIIFDFSRSQGDLIDVFDIDANINKAGNQAFAFIEDDAFHRKAGELRYQKKAGDTYIHGDVNGDGRADFTIVLDRSLDMTKYDFVL